MGGGRNTSQVLVTGATGAVGPQVVAALSAAGHRVRCLSLDPVFDGSWPQGVEALTGDITDPAHVRVAIRGAEAVVHLAALLHIADPAAELRPRYEAVNVGGTSNVVRAATEADVRRIVYFSTIAVYGSPGGRVVDETTPAQPQTYYERTKHSAEKLVLAARGLDGQHTGTVLRLAAVYGPRIKGNYQKMLRALAKGRFIPVGDGRNRRTLVYDRDVARAAVLALEHPQAAGKIFNVSDNRFHTVDEIIAAMCAALGRRPPRLRLPVHPVRFAAGLVEDAARRLGVQPPVRRAMIDKYVDEVMVDNRRIQNELGFAPRFDLAAGWQDAVREMRRAGDL